MSQSYSSVYFSPDSLQEPSPVPSKPWVLSNEEVNGNWAAAQSGDKNYKKSILWSASTLIPSIFSCVFDRPRSHENSYLDQEKSISYHLPQAMGPLQYKVDCHVLPNIFKIDVHQSILHRDISMYTHIGKFYSPNSAWIAYLPETGFPLLFSWDWCCHAELLGHQKQPHKCFILVSHGASAHLTVLWGLERSYIFGSKSHELQTTGLQVGECGALPLQGYGIYLCSHLDTLDSEGAFGYQQSHKHGPIVFFLAFAYGSVCPVEE